MAIVKTLHIPTYILNLFNVEDIEMLEYLILGVFGLIFRLGIKGVVEVVLNAPLANFVDRRIVELDLVGRPGPSQKGQQEPRNPNCNECQTFAPCARTQWHHCPPASRPPRAQLCSVLAAFESF